MQTVFIYEPEKKELCLKKSEIYRYLGYRIGTGMEVTEEMDDLVEEICRKVLDGSTPKVCYKKYSIRPGEEIDFGFMRIKSENLKVNLEGCHEVIIFAATIGVFTDRQIKKESILSPARALVYQAVGAEVIEAVCNEFNEYINRTEYDKGNVLKPRYSPGYGDVSIEVQKDILRELDCAKTIGVTLTDSLLMIPEKSVTAFIGIKKK